MIMNNFREKRNLLNAVIRGKETSEERDSTTSHRSHKTAILSQVRDTDVTLGGAPSPTPHPKPEGIECVQRARVSHSKFLFNVF